MIEVKDKQLECTKCGRTFLFSAQEAQSFLDRGLTNVPKKCPEDRAKDRAKKEQKIRTLVQCAACRVEFEVPFAPALDTAGRSQRPLYCIEHFESRGEQPDQTQPPAAGQPTPSA